MPRFLLGVDTSKGYADFSLTDHAGAQLPGSQRYDDTPTGHRAVRTLCEELFSRYPDAELLVGLEASGGLERNWLRLFREILSAGKGRVYQLNPLAVKRYLQRDLHRNVTDPLSARGIAAYLREGLRPADRPHEPQMEGPRTLYRFVTNAQERCIELQNELHSLLPCVHPDLVPYCRNGYPAWLLHLLARYPTAEALRRARPTTLTRIPYLTAERAATLVKAAQASVASLRDPHTGLVVATLAKQILEAQRQITTFKERLMAELAADPEVKLVSSITGIGTWTAVALRLEYGSLAAFHSDAAVIAFAGLDPRRHQSGDSDRHPGISRRGRKEIRAALYMAALTAVRCNEPVRDFYARLRAAGKDHMVALTACMAKLLRIAYACVITEKPFDPQEYQAVQERYRQREELGITAGRQPAAGQTPLGAGEAATAPLAVGAVTAPVSRREAQRRRAATKPQVGVPQQVRGHGAALASHDSGRRTSCQPNAIQLSKTR